MGANILFVSTQKKLMDAHTLTNTWARSHQTRAHTCELRHRQLWIPPRQSWQITLSTGCPTLGGCYNSVSSDEKRGTSPTWSHWTRRQAFTFMLPGRFISLRSLRFFAAGAAAEQSLSGMPLIRLVDLFPLSSSSFCGLSGVVLGEEGGAGHMTQLNLLTVDFRCFDTASKLG